MTQRYRKLVAVIGAAGALAVAAAPMAQAKHGADDPPNHEVVHHHKHHRHHNANHARHGGKDDPAGHDRNDDRGGDR